MKMTSNNELVALDTATVTESDITDIPGVDLSRLFLGARFVTAVSDRDNRVIGDILGEFDDDCEMMLFLLQLAEDFQAEESVIWLIRAILDERHGITVEEPETVDEFSYCACDHIGACFSDAVYDENWILVDEILDDELLISALKLAAVEERWALCQDIIDMLFELHGRDLEIIVTDETIQINENMPDELVLMDQAA